MSDLDEVIVTEIETTVRVYRVRACDVSDAVNRLQTRNEPGWPKSEIERVSVKTERRYAGAVATPASQPTAPAASSR